KKKKKKDREAEIREWVNLLIDGNCNEEETRFGSAKLLEAFESDQNRNDEKNVMEIVLTAFAKDRPHSSHSLFVDQLLSIISSDFYDVFCVRNIVKLIHQMILCDIAIRSSSWRSTYLFQDLNQVQEVITQIKLKWSNPLLVPMSTHCRLELPPSKQIVKCCNACLQTIATMP
ncbi:hypothetical protein RFI_05960, partial [Reticulomyxa filosa]